MPLNHKRSILMVLLIVVAMCTCFGCVCLPSDTHITSPVETPVVSTSTPSTFATEAYVFGNKTILGETSIRGPAIASFNGTLYLAWAGTDGTGLISIMTSKDGVTWNHKQILNETSIASPALCVYGNKLYLAWTGTDLQGHISVMSSGDGVNWEDKKIYTETSIAGPTMCVYNNKLYLSWTGTDGQGHLSVMTA